MTQNFLYQNLHSMVEKIMWATLHQQPRIYQASLTQLTEWVQRYFVQDADVTRAMLADLNQLQKINIAPLLPNLDDALHAFAIYRDKNNA